MTEDVPCEDGYIAALRADGIYECIENIKPPIALIWSPNGKWGVTQVSKNKFYDQTSNPIWTMVESKVEEILWLPNSSSLFLISSGQLLYVEIPEGNLLIVDDHNPSELSWIGVN